MTAKRAHAELLQLIAPLHGQTRRAILRRANILWGARPIYRVTIPPKKIYRITLKK